MRTIKAAVVKATELFDFAEQKDITTDIQDQIYHSGAAHCWRHRRWFRRPQFTVVRNEFDYLNWLPHVEEMVYKYMTVHGVEVLVVLTDK